MAYEYEYEDGGDEYGGRVLWGRIIVFGLAALLLLVLGRCTVGGGGDGAELAALQSDNESLRADNEELTNAVATLQERIRDMQPDGGTGTATPGGTDAPTTSVDGTTAPGPPPAGSSESTYVVQEGDTLASIAQNVYGTPQAFGIIAEANGLTESSPLQIGQELTIPPNPDAGGTATEG